MRKFLTSVLAIAALTSALNAGDKYSGITADYLQNNVSVEVKRIVASDPLTDPKTLALLFHDKDLTVRGNVVANPNY